MRDPRPWARFRRSRPGRVLTYLLLPCTLPFEYAYFRSRRLVVWLPDMLADLRWVQGLLRSAAVGVYSRTKDQLLGLVSPLATSLQPPAGGSPSRGPSQGAQTCPALQARGAPGWASSVTVCSRLPPGGRPGLTPPRAWTAESSPWPRLGTGIAGRVEDQGQPPFLPRTLVPARVGGVPSGARGDPRSPPGCPAPWS
ncbi:patatin like phospholipase domain containing 5 [Phyllostomus discolor]|nr:patatin like phospholipase domain containing 5 [Phyllostomus discolor]